MPVYKPQQKIMIALGRLEVLRRDQFTRLLFSPGSQTYVSEHLTALTREEYLLRRPMKTDRNGNPPSVWRLAEKGRHWLINNGYDAPATKTHGAHERGHDYYLEHSLCVNDFLIACERYSRQTGIPMTYLNEHTLKVDPPKTQLNGRTLTIDPDAFARLGEERLWLELDRSTEEEKKFVQKVERIISLYETGAYEQYFDTEELKVAVVAVKGQRRADQLLGWIEHSLTKLGKKEWAHVFFVTGADPATCEAFPFFCSQHWKQPFRALACPLLGGQP